MSIQPAASHAERVARILAKLTAIHEARQRAAKKKAALCRHCRRKPIGRPRGLCWRCFYDERIRAQYISTSRYGYRGAGLGDDDRPAPATSTKALPGSANKIEILVARAHGENALWADGDAKPGMAGREIERRDLQVCHDSHEGNGKREEYVPRVYRVSR